MTDKLTDQQKREKCLEIMDGLFDYTNTKTQFQEWADLSRTQLTHRQRTIVALAGAYNHMWYRDLALLLHRCCHDHPCRNVLCPHCRTLAQRRMSSSLHDHFGTTPKHRLRFVTILLPVTYDPIAKLKGMRESFRRDLDATFNKFANDNIRVAGAYELDVKHPAYAKSKHAQDVLKGLGMHFVGQNDNAYLLHLHAVVDLGSADKEAVGNALRKRLPGRYRVRIDPLYRTKTKSENLDCIGHYVTKTRLQYADNYFDSQHGKARYMDFYPDYVIRTVARSMYNLNSIHFYVRYGFGLK